MLPHLPEHLELRVLRLRELEIRAQFRRIVIGRLRSEGERLHLSFDLLKLLLESNALFTLSSQFVGYASALLVRLWLQLSEIDSAASHQAEADEGSPESEHPLESLFLRILVEQRELLFV